MIVGRFRRDEIHGSPLCEDRQLSEDLVQETFWEACEHWALTSLAIRRLSEVTRSMPPV